MGIAGRVEGEGTLRPTQTGPAQAVMSQRASMPWTNLNAVRRRAQCMHAAGKQSQMCSIVARTIQKCAAVAQHLYNRGAVAPKHRRVDHTALAQLVTALFVILYYLMS